MLVEVKRKRIYAWSFHWEYIKFLTYASHNWSPECGKQNLMKVKKNRHLKTNGWELQYSTFKYRYVDEKRDFMESKLREQSDHKFLIGQHVMMGSHSLGIQLLFYFFTFLTFKHLYWGVFDINKLHVFKLCNLLRVYISANITTDRVLSIYMHHPQKVPSVLLWSSRLPSLQPWPHHP